MAVGAEPLGRLPALYPEWLGDRRFVEQHGLRFAYVAGEMARGIAGVEMVAAVARAGMLGVFGAAGLPPAQVAAAIDALQDRLGPDGPGWGVNLIHSPFAPDLEAAVLDLLVARGVRLVSVSAFMALTPGLVRLACQGLRRGPDGAIRRVRHLFAKLSRPEVARHFMRPPPAPMLAELVAAGALTAQEAELGSTLPVACEITAEADSGGHTDGRPLHALLPALLALRRQVAPGAAIRIGAAGGLGTPEAVAAAFALGADYVVTGSVNQATVEAATSPAAKRMLAAAGLAEVALAPAADMFEIGAKVQVLTHGTMFAQRANRLAELYRSCDGIAGLPPAVRARLERDVFRQPLDSALAEVRAFFAGRDPAELERADRDKRHEMALLFRWYLGLSSRWPLQADESRQADFQIWCGPAMGAFNAWVAGSFLAELENRSVVQIARNLLEGAACITRAQQFRALGLSPPPAAFHFAPRPLA